MNEILTLLVMLSALVVIVHSLNMTATLNVRNWEGHRLEFALTAAAHAFVFGGSLGVAAGWPPGAILLLLGVAGLILTKGKWQ